MARRYLTVMALVVTVSVAVVAAANLTGASRAASLLMLAAGVIATAGGLLVSIRRSIGSGRPGGTSEERGPGDVLLEPIELRILERLGQGDRRG